MENEKTPLYVAFSTQKGGVGKTTFTVLAASYLYYLKGYDVAVVDCDYPQHSIAGMRKRDAEQIGADEDYKRMAYEQFTQLGKKAYPVLCSSPEKAIATADEYIAAGHVPDIVFFDLPGTVNSEGVINSLAGMDYIFTPISADKVVPESSLYRTKKKSTPIQTDQKSEINFSNIVSVYVCQISSAGCLYSSNSCLTYSISKTNL